MDEDRRIADADDVPGDDTLLVTLSNGDGEEVEAILTSLADGVVAWRNYCKHWTDVRLDRGDGAPIRDGDVLCRKHGATFEKGSGVCTFGPCEGAQLEGVDVTVADGGVYLTDDDYAFVRVGAAEDDDPFDDLSTSPGAREGF